MAKVHQLYGEKTSAPPSDPAVHVPIESPAGRDRGSGIAGLDGAERPTLLPDVPSIAPCRIAKPFADVGRSPAEARKPKAKLKFAPSRSIGAIVSPGLERTCPPDVRSACERICPDDGGPECAWFKEVLTKLPLGVGKQNHEQGLKLAHFTIDESVPVPPSRYNPGIPFMIDEKAKKERLTWDQVKHWATEYCYHMITKVGLQPSNRRKSFEVSTVLLTVVLHLRPGELRNIRWRDLKAQYVAFPDSPNKAGQKVSYGTFTEVIIELLKSWRTDAELDSDFVFDFTERTFERITHRVFGEGVSPKDLRRLKEFHIEDSSPEQYTLVKALRMLKAGTGLRSGDLWKTPEETHRYDTGLEHGFAHPDPQVTRHIKHQRVSGWKGKGVDH